VRHPDIIEPELCSFIITIKLIMFSLTDKYFDFLLKSGFKGPYEYNSGHEMQSDYVKKDLIIKISYDGRYFASIIKTKKIIPGLEEGTKTLKDIDYNLIISHDLEDLDPKKRLFNLIASNNEDEKYLLYYSRLLKDNPEILSGNLSKFNLVNYLLRKSGLKK
jgi:hypothetical protein